MTGDELYRRPFIQWFLTLLIFTLFVPASGNEFCRWTPDCYNFITKPVFMPFEKPALS
jgi:hypothetical protein